MLELFKNLIKKQIFSFFLIKNRQNLNFYYFKRSSRLTSLIEDDNLGFVCFDNFLYKINKQDSLFSFINKNKSFSLQPYLCEQLTENTISWQDINKLLLRQKITREKFFSLMNITELPDEINRQLTLQNIDKNINIVKTINKNKI